LLHLYPSVSEFFLLKLLQNRGKKINEYLAIKETAFFKISKQTLFYLIEKTCTASSVSLKVCIDRIEEVAFQNMCHVNES